MTIEFEFDQIHRVIYQHLMSAKKSVKVAVAWLNFDLYKNAFETLLENGIALSIVIDDNDSNKRYKRLIDQLRNRNANIHILQMPLRPKYKQNESRYIMHHKFAIIDDEIILAGSYNWSEAAMYNFEHLFVLTGPEPEIISKFNEEFEFLLSMNIEKLESFHQLPECRAEDCPGKLFNLLVFDPNSQEGGRVYGTLLNICTEDPHSHFHTTDTDISDRFLQDAAEAKNYHYEQLFDFCENPEHDEYTREKRKKDIDKMIDDDMMKAIKSIGNADRIDVIHAISVLKRDKMWHKHEDPDWFTEVLWKQRFCFMHVDDRYDTAFDLC